MFYILLILRFYLRTAIIIISLSTQILPLIYSHFNILRNNYLRWLYLSHIRLCPIQIWIVS